MIPKRGTATESPCSNNAQRTLCDSIARNRRAHEFVNGIILLPDFGQSGVNLEWETEDCCLRARSAFERRIPQPPSPPGFGAGRAQSFCCT
jgi:hypothetical protein